MRYRAKKYILILLSGFIPATAYVMFAWLPFVLMSAVNLFIEGVLDINFNRYYSYIEMITAVITPVIAIWLLTEIWSYIGGALSILEIPCALAGLVAAIPSALLSAMCFIYPKTMADGYFSMLYNMFASQLGRAFTPSLPTWVAYIYTPLVIALFFMAGWRYGKMKRIKISATLMGFFGGLHLLFAENIRLFALAPQLVCLALTSYFMIKDGLRSGREGRGFGRKS